jgi:hypothetical protein
MVSADLPGRSAGSYREVNGGKIMHQIRWLRSGVAAVVVAASFAMPTAAWAYYLRNDNGGACATDGSACHVICQNPDESMGPRAGTMYWNGSVWSDGVRSDANPYVVASAIVAAQGTNCH